MIYLEVQFIGDAPSGYVIPSVSRWFPDVPRVGESIDVCYSDKELGRTPSADLWIHGVVKRVMWLDTAQNMRCTVRYE